jgi:solute carrier family 35 protein
MVTQRTLVFCGLYGLTSSCLLVLNKLAVQHIPSPAVVLLSQVLFTTVLVVFLVLVGYVKISSVALSKTFFHFSLIVLSFVTGIYANIRVLQVLNVETVIVARSCTVLVVCFIETLFLDREFPRKRSVASLISILVFAVLYVEGDINFVGTGYMWLALWFFMLVFSMTYVKHVCNVLCLSTWEQVFFTNALSVPVLLMLVYYNGEVGVLKSAKYVLTFQSAMILLVSCIFGVGISFSSYSIRGELSATSFDLLGIVCKFGTVLLNVALELEHANFCGFACLCGILASAYFYQQAPMRSSLVHNPVRDETA